MTGRSSSSVPSLHATRCFHVPISSTQKGMCAKALAENAVIQQRLGDDPSTAASLVCIYGRSGEKARREFEKLKRMVRRRLMDPEPLLAASIGLGDKEQAIALLQKGYLLHSNV